MHTYSPQNWGVETRKPLGLTGEPVQANPGLWFWNGCSHCVAQADLKLRILQPQPPEPWNRRPCHLWFPQSFKETISSFVSFFPKSVQGKWHRKFKEEIKVGEHHNSIPEEGNESRLCTPLETRIQYIDETQYYTNIFTTKAWAVMSATARVIPDPDSSLTRCLSSRPFNHILKI